MATSSFSLTTSLTNVIVQVSCCKKNPTIARLRSVIFSAIDNAKTASKQPILGGAVPAVYIALEERIIQEAKRLRQESSAYPIIHERRMRQLANEVTGKGTGSEKLSKEKMTQVKLADLVRCCACVYD